MSNEAIPLERVNALRLKVRHLLGTSAVSKPIFRPGDKEQWVLERAYHKCKLVVGTVTDAQGISLTNTVNNIVAPVDLFTVEGQAQKLDVIGDAVITNAHPLTLVVTDPGSVGSGAQLNDTLRYDLTLFLERIFP